tara:strand:+ start:3696 stop:4040 length:345 start_codon:yes stop_codon:yes gene_type:complete
MNLDPGQYVYWNGEIRRIDAKADDTHTWLQGKPGDPNRAFAPSSDLEPIPTDYELLIRDVKELSDSELSEALDFLENAKLNNSDRPAATKKRKVAIKEEIRMSSKETMDLLNSI